jgi:hypothetical protein
MDTTRDRHDDSGGGRCDPFGRRPGYGTGGATERLNVGARTPGEHGGGEGHHDRDDGECTDAGATEIPRPAARWFASMA